MPAHSPLRLGNYFARAAGTPDLVAVFEQLVPNPGRLVRLRVEMGDIGDVDRQLLLDDAAGLAHARLCVPARDMHALHDQAPLIGEDAQHLAALALVAAADHDDVVAPLDLH